MFKRLMAGILMAICLFTFAGCYVHTHVVGNGPQQGIQVKQRQWYALWGLVPITNVDTTALAGGAKDYKIESAWTPMDILIDIFTGVVSIECRTVTITK